MTIQEVCTELRSELKPYIGKMKHSTFFSTLARIENGSAKPATVKALFEKFGYVGSYNEWEKNEKVTA